MVTSLDGIIARRDNQVSWFETTDYFEKGIELSNQDQEDFLKSIDCYVMGSHTYEHALELEKTYGWAYGDKPTIVLTTRKLKTNKKNIVFFAGELKTLVDEWLKPNYRNIWVAGGAALARDFICLQLADEIRLTILPIILGDGIILFDGTCSEQALHLKDTTAYKNGTVELCYVIKK
jgi:dihydrofolate reductase